MQTNTFLLYGATGYTGKLIARYTIQYGLQPILCGRNKENLEPLARSMELPFVVAPIDDSAALEAALQNVNLVVHAAGPFELTAQQMIEACLKTGTHYIDINGDISVFELIKRYDIAAKEAGIMLLPGAGFDVVPTDCIALFLKNRMPDASTLELAFASLGGGISHGTAMTMASRLGEGGAIRKEGKIVRDPLGKKGKWIDFGRKKIFVMSIPWGDISTAHFTTGIPTITTYTGITPAVFKLLKFQFLFNWLLRTNLIRRFIKKKIKNRPAGPSDSQREKAISLVWGQVKNNKGELATARMSGPEGYTLTMHSTLIISKRILSGDFKVGYQTPGSAYGEDLILAIPGVIREAVI